MAKELAFKESLDDRGATQHLETTGLATALSLCKALAARSLPVPVFPVMGAVLTCGEMRLNTRSHFAEGAAADHPFERCCLQNPAFKRVSPLALPVSSTRR